MTSAEAMSGLASIVGGGGIVSVIIAWLGLKQEAMKGRRGDPDGRSVAVAIGDVYAEKREKEALTLAVRELTAAVLKYAALIEEASDRKERDREIKVLIGEMRQELDRK